MMILRLLLIGILMTPHVNAIEITGHIRPRDKGIIGDILRYEIITTTNHQIKVIHPDYQDQLGPFKILKKENVINKTDTQKIQKTSVQLTIYETGEFRVPTQTIITIENGNTHTFDIPAIPIEIKSIRNPKDGSPDITGLLTNKISSLWMALVISLSLCGGILGWRQLKNKKTKRRTNQLKKTDKTPEEIAYFEISALEHQRYFEKEEETQYVEKIAEILKTYLSEKYLVSMTELTTQEVYVIVTQKNMQSETLKRVRHLLARCDKVKFSKQALEKQDYDTLIIKLKDVINRVKGSKNDT